MTPPEPDIAPLREWASWARRFDPEEAEANLVDAIPAYPARPMSTVEIWHAAKAPKPPFHRARAILRGWADANCGLERIGGPVGAQWYRLTAELEDFIDMHWDETHHFRLKSEPSR